MGKCCDCSEDLRRKERLRSSSATLRTICLHLSLKGRGMRVCKGCLDDQQGASQLGLSLLSPPCGLTMSVCLGFQPFVKTSQPPLASWAERQGGGQGARSHLSLSGDVLHTAGPAFLPAAPAARAAGLEKMQNMHIANNHSSSRLQEPGSSPSRCEADPFCLQPWTPQEHGTRGLPRHLISVLASPCPRQSPEVWG